MNAIIQGSNRPLRVLIDGIVSGTKHAVLKWDNQELKAWTDAQISLSVSNGKTVLLLPLTEAETINFPEETMARLLIKWTGTGYIDFASIIDVPIIKFDDPTMFA